MAVSVNGGAVGVMSEKESLTALGRDELLDGRAAKADVLARYVCHVRTISAVPRWDGWTLTGARVVAGPCPRGNRCAVTQGNVLHDLARERCSKGTGSGCAQ